MQVFFIPVNIYIYINDFCHRISVDWNQYNWKVVVLQSFESAYEFKSNIWKRESKTQYLIS